MCILNDALITQVYISYLDLASFSHDVSPRGNRVANSETKMKHFVGLLRQYYWVPDGQKSTASSSDPLGSISINLSLFSKKAQTPVSALGASYYISGKCFVVPALRPYAPRNKKTRGAVHTNYRIKVRYLVQYR